MNGAPLGARRAAPSEGRFVNTGTGPTWLPVDIGHEQYVALTDPATAFWALVRKDQLADTLAGGALLESYREKSDQFARELHKSRDCWEGNGSRRHSSAATT